MVHRAERLAVVVLNKMGDLLQSVIGVKVAGAWMACPGAVGHRA